MPNASSSALDMRKLDLMFEVNETTQTKEIAQRFASTLPGGHRVAAGTLLPAGEADYYLWFHIDQNDDDRENKRMFVHLAFARRPKTPPPQDVDRGRREGITIDSFVRDLSKATGQDSVDVLVDAEIRVAHASDRKRPRAKSMTVGGNKLSQVGAEYVASPMPARGLREYRWSDKSTKYRSVWLEYAMVWTWNDPWGEGCTECQKYLREL